MCEDKGMGESASFVSDSHPEGGCRAYWAWLDLAEGGGAD